MDEITLSQSMLLQGRDNLQISTHHREERFLHRQSIWSKEGFILTITNADIRRILKNLLRVRDHLRAPTSARRIPSPVSALQPVSTHSITHAKEYNNHMQ